MDALREFGGGRVVDPELAIQIRAPDAFMAMGNGCRPPESPPAAAVALAPAAAGAYSYFKYSGRVLVLREWRE
jgi:hypothetical protein